MKIEEMEVSSSVELQSLLKLKMNQWGTYISYDIKFSLST